MDKQTVADVAVIAGIAASAFTFLGGYAGLIWFIAGRFRAMEKLAYRLHAENNARFVRLEMWANRQGFQPGVDPFDFNGKSHVDRT